MGEIINTNTAIEAQPNGDTGTLLDVIQSLLVDARTASFITLTHSTISIRKSPAGLFRQTEGYVPLRHIPFLSNNAANIISRHLRVLPLYSQTYNPHLYLWKAKCLLHHVNFSLACDPKHSFRDCHRKSSF